ncbi:MAG: hypothetical protein H6732_14075 [Alphaproteobacteria bacterium]|nr:hypothetical protein [Alphaproteobacteria bacterium]
MTRAPARPVRTPAQVAAHLRAEAAALAAGGAVEAPDATARQELARTPAAAAVSREAARQGLFHFHFEHRVHLELPEAWLDPASGPGAGDPPAWEAGVLPEPKYQAFRHDLAVASYHPGHRAKWAVHELCHGLVGFAWQPGASPFFHATAGRLAELLPVALWYFLDEAFLRRCPDHQGQGALYRASCARCEALAGPLADDEAAEAHLEAGQRFVARELDAVARSRREGRPIPHRHATLDLCSDGVAYARSHGTRLAHPAFAGWMERFAVAGGGWSPSLDALEDRVLAVFDHLLGGPPPPALAPSALHGRWRWTLQDLGARLVQHGLDLPRRAAARVALAVDALAEAVPATTRADDDPDAAGRRALQRVQEALEPLGTGPEVWATGYALPGLPPATEGLAEGLPTATPLVVDLLGPRLPEALTAFAAHDLAHPRRLPLAARWAAWWATQQAPVVADLAAWEAAATHATTPLQPPLGPARDARRALADGVQLVRAAHDVLALAERVDAGGLQLGAGPGWGVDAVDGQPLAPAPTALVVALAADGELLVLDVDPETADVLAALDPPAPPDLPDDERLALEEHGILVPAAVAEQDASL